jgi:hypothetical protein
VLFSRPSSTFTASPSFQFGRQSAPVRACHGLVLGDRCGMRRVMKTVASWRSALMSEDMHFVACHRWHKSHRGHRCWSVPSPSRCFATPTLRVRQQSRLPLRVRSVVSRMRRRLQLCPRSRHSLAPHQPTQRARLGQLAHAPSRASLIFSVIIAPVAGQLAAIVPPS